MRFDLRPRRLQVVGQAAAAHRLADVNRGSTAGHGVNDQAAGGRIVVQRVGDDGRWNRTGMGNAKGTVMPERPDIVRGGPEIGRESIAAAKILVGCVDGFGAGIKLSDAAAGAGVVFLSHLPDRPGLPIQVFAAQSQAAGDRACQCDRVVPQSSASPASLA